MRDQIALITSDGHGNPSPGRSLHFVRFSDNPHMHAVNQMSAGGRYPYYDCAPADALSRLLDDGHGAPMTTVESFMVTNNSYGTSLANLQSGLQRLGYACHFSPTPPSPGYVMNPAWGGIIPPAQCGSYIAYSTHQTIIIDTPGAWEQQASLEESMGTFVTPSGIQVIFYVDRTTHHIMEMWYAANGWNGPVDVSVQYFHGFLASGQLAAMYVPGGPNGNQVIFFSGADGHQYEAWWNGAWNGPVPLPRT